MNPIASLYAEIGANLEPLKKGLGGAADMLSETASRLGTIALVGGLAIGAALGGGIISSVNEAMKSQDAMAGLDAVLKSTGEAAKSQAADYDAASKRMVTSTALPADKLKDLQDQLAKATARVSDLDSAFINAKSPSASMSLNLKNARDDVADLQEQIAKGSQVMTSTLAKQMGLVPPAIQPTREQLVLMAGDLQNVTKYSDESAMGAEEMLLQFRTIGKDVFPQAISVAADLAERLHTDLPGAAQMLGKALVDPGVGLLRLKAAGVAFDDSQIAVIKKLNDTGKTAEAQKMILDELTKSIGGAAVAAGSTFSGKLTILQNKFSDVQETIGGAFLPLLTQVADGLIGALASPEVQAGINNVVGWITTTIPAALRFLMAFLASLKGESAGGIAAIILGTLGVSGDLSARIGNFVDNFVGVLSATFQGKLDLSSIIAGALGGGDAGATGKIGGILASLQTSFQGLIGWLTGSLVPAIATAGAQIGTALMPVLETLGGWFNTVGIPALQAFWNWLSPMLGAAVVALGGYIVKDLIPNFANWITAMAAGAGPLGAFINQVAGGLNDGLRTAGQLWFILSTGFQNGVKFVNDMKTKLGELAGVLNGDITAAIQAFNDNVLTPIKDTLSAIVGFIQGVIKALGDLATLLGLGTEGLREAFNTLYGGGRAVGGMVNSGMSYLVGERGPELFTPGATGAITPNNRLSMGGGSGGMTLQFVYAPRVSLLDEGEIETTAGPALVQYLKAHGF